MIRDVDLNDENLGEYDPRNLRSHRLSPNPPNEVGGRMWKRGKESAPLNLG